MALDIHDISYLLHFSRTRYTELIKKQFELQANYGCSLNPFTEIDYMETYKNEKRRKNNSIEVDADMMVPSDSTYDFKSFPRWDLGLS